VNHLAASLHPPTTDSERLATSQTLGDMLDQLATQVQAWVESLAALNLPRPILDAFAGIPDGLHEAADNARRAAVLFAGHFQETRDVASRGLTITGYDTA
jgi:hypothetical protein